MQHLPRNPTYPIIRPFYNNENEVLFRPYFGSCSADTCAKIIQTDVYDDSLHLPPGVGRRLGKSMDETLRFAQAVRKWRSTKLRATRTYGVVFGRSSSRKASGYILQQWVAIAAQSLPSYFRQNDPILLRNSLYRR